jgi:hypothetical protein
MAENEEFGNADLRKGRTNCLRLIFWGPHLVSGTIAVAKPGAIKCDDAVLSCSSFYEATRYKVLNHTSIAMQKDECWPGSLLEVMKSDALCTYYATLRRI